MCCQPCRLFNDLHQLTVSLAPAPHMQPEEDGACVGGSIMGAYTRRASCLNAAPGLRRGLGIPCPKYFQ